MNASVIGSMPRIPDDAGFSASWQFCSIWSFNWFVHLCHPAIFSIILFTNMFQRFCQICRFTRRSIASCPRSTWFAAMVVMVAKSMSLSQPLDAVLPVPLADNITYLFANDDFLVQFCIRSHWVAYCLSWRKVPCGDLINHTWNSTTGFRCLSSWYIPILLESLATKWFGLSALHVENDRAEVHFTVAVVQNRFCRNLNYFEFPDSCELGL